MPEKRTKNAIETAVTPRPKREEIFEQISAVKDWTVVRRFVGDVFSHSTEDGLALSKRLNIEGAELAFCIMNSVFVAKHPDVFKQLTREVFTSGALEEIEASSTGEFLAGNIKKWHDALLENEKSGEWGDNIPSTEYIGSDENNRIKNQIDDYYAPLLATRKLQPRRHISEYPVGETVKGLKSGETRQLKSPEELADEALHQAELIVMPAYYASNVLEILNKYLKRNDSNETADFAGIDGMFVVEGDIKQQCLEHGIPFEEIESQIKGVKYSSITADIKSSEAQKVILKKVNQSLSGRGQKVEFVRDRDRYEVVEDKEKKEKKEKIDAVIENYWDEAISFKISGIPLVIHGQNIDQGELLCVTRNTLIISEFFQSFDLALAHFLIDKISYDDGYLNISGLRDGKKVTERVKLDDDVVAEIEKTIPKEKAGEKEPKVIEVQLNKRIEELEDKPFQLGGKQFKFQTDSRRRQYLLEEPTSTFSSGFLPFSQISKVQYNDGAINIFGIRQQSGKPEITTRDIHEVTDIIEEIEGREKAEISKELTEEEKKQVELLNLLYHPTLDGIDSHFNSEENANKRQQNPLSGSRVFSGIINKIIGEQLKEFLNTIPAKRDRNLAGVYAEQLAMRIFPEIKRKREQNAWRGFGGYAGLESGRESGQPADPEDYLNPRSSAEMLGGGAEQLNDNREIMELREPIDELIATSIYGRYNASSKQWEKFDFPIDSEISEPIGETTFTLPSVGKLAEVSLPKPIEAKVIAERVKGFDAGGKEYDLKIQVNQLGETKVVKKPKTVEKIVYSIQLPQISEPLADLSARDYLKYKKQFELKNGAELSGEIAGMPEDLELELIDVTKDKSPKEQVVAIEQLVRRLGYYDRDNQEVNRLKAGKSLEEQLYIMQQRVDELRQQKPELADKLEGKRFAGVCADFAQITAILLRRAGFNSGTVMGFRTEDKKVCVKNAHATAFVVWPDVNGHNRVVSIDGTPDGVAGISMASLMERESEAINKEKELSAETMKEIQKIIDGLNKLDAETVRKMSNGELEKVLNGILKYQVKESHLAIIERLLDYYWYTPIHNLDLQNPAQKGEAVMDLAGAVEAQREWLKNHPEKDEKPAGNKLMEVMRDFLRRFTVAGQTEDKYAAIELMDKIVELVQNDLSEIEKKAAFAIIAYLKAQNILGDKK